MFRKKKKKKRKTSNNKKYDFLTARLQRYFLIN